VTSLRVIFSERRTR